MASANLKKLTMQQFCSMKKHFDDDERIRLEHSNKDIDKTKTKDNFWIGAKNWDETVLNVKQRVKEVDEKQPPIRIKKDRKVVASFETPCPKIITDMGKSDEFFKVIHNTMENLFGKENVAGSSVHKDEVHDYKVKNRYTEEIETRTSLEHMTTEVVPYTSEKGVNMKNFATKTMLINLNKALDQACYENFGVHLLTGEGTKSNLEVEELKLQSMNLEIEELQKETKNLVEENKYLLEENTQLRAKYNKLDLDFDKKVADITKNEQKLDNRIKERVKILDETNNNIQEKTTQLQDVENTLQDKTKLVNQAIEDLQDNPDIKTTAITKAIEKLDNPEQINQELKNSLNYVTHNNIEYKKENKELKETNIALFRENKKLENAVKYFQNKYYSVAGVLKGYYNKSKNCINKAWDTIKDKLGIEPDTTDINAVTNNEWKVIHEVVEDKDILTDEELQAQKDENEEDVEE